MSAVRFQRRFEHADRIRGAAANALGQAASPISSSARGTDVVVIPHSLALGGRWMRWRLCEEDLLGLRVPSTTTDAHKRLDSQEHRLCARQGSRGGKRPVSRDRQSDHQVDNVGHN